MAGLSTTRSAPLVGSSRVVLAFEPEPTNFYMLAGNVALNGLQNVRAFNKAWERHRTIEDVSDQGQPGQS
jgi:FkbM family methyltransferase